jgi:hypothetical protein
MHVPQPDGSTLRLCYLGRIVRALDMLNAERKPAVEARYWEIVAEANEAWADYVKARNAYINRCAWLGVEPDEPTERECNCPVCAAWQPPTVHLGDVVSMESIDSASMKEAQP